MDVWNISHVVWPFVCTFDIPIDDQASEEREYVDNDINNKGVGAAHALTTVNVDDAACDLHTLREAAVVTAPRNKSLR